MQTTFAMIKPDAVKAGYVDEIVKKIENNGFKILEKRNITIPHEQAMRLYDVHKDKPFIGEMVEFITSGPVVVLALEKENAIAAWRELMGATNPADAAEGTIRKLYGASIGHNAVHGSDAPETAKAELALFFPEHIA